MGVLLHVLSMKKKLHSAPTTCRRRSTLKKPRRCERARIEELSYEALEKVDQIIIHPSHVRARFKVFNVLGGQYRRIRGRHGHTSVKQYVW
jgi:hypothetical protein